MVAAVPPLSVDGVSVKRETLRVPLRSMDVTPFPHYYQDIRLPRQPQDSSWFCQLCLLTPRRRTAWDLPSSRLCLDDVPRSQTPVDPTVPWSSGLSVLPSGSQIPSASTGVVHIGAQSLHAGALPPIISLCTLRQCRYRHSRNTQYRVPDQGFQD